MQMAPAADAGTRLLVSRMLARELARPFWLLHGATDEAPAAAHYLHLLPGCAKHLQTAERKKSARLSAANAAEACRRLLYNAMWTSFDAQLLAHNLLAQSYRRACQLRLQKDELILPLVQRLGGPLEWGRCTACCRHFRSISGIRKKGLVDFWLQGFAEEARTEAVKLAVQHNVVFLLGPLAAARANLNCVFEQFWFRTPLHRVASRGHIQLCERLLQLSAEPARRDSHGATALHLAASKGRLQIVELLLRSDPSGVSAADYSGRTACHMAALKGHLAVVQHLVLARASVSAQALNGQLPIDMANRGEFADVAHFLEQCKLREDREAEASGWPADLVLAAVE
ncbi:unnamed protein product, partial [Polarella glacialis]